MTKITDHLNIQGLHPMEARKFIGQKPMKEKIEGKKGLEFIKAVGKYFAKEIALTYSRIVHKVHTGQWINKHSIETAIEKSIKELSQIDHTQDDLDQIEAYMALGSMQTVCHKLQKKMETFNFALRFDLENIKKNYEDFIIQKNEENLKKHLNNFAQHQVCEIEAEILAPAPKPVDKPAQAPVEDETAPQTSQVPPKPSDKQAQDSVEDEASPQTSQMPPKPSDKQAQDSVEDEVAPKTSVEKEESPEAVQEVETKEAVQEVETKEAVGAKIIGAEQEFRQELKNNFPNFIKTVYGEDYDLSTRAGRLSSQLYNSLQQNWPVGGTYGMGLMASSDNAHLLKMMDANYYDKNSVETIMKDMQQALSIITKGYKQDRLIEWEYPSIVLEIQAYENIISDFNNQK